jgi:non-specific serine/threonine protein kinase
MEGLRPVQVDARIVSFAYLMTRTTSHPSAAPRYFGRFELRQQLGRSIASQMWLVSDSRQQQEVALCVPRVQPLNQTERDLWTQDVQLGARLKHPHLVPVLEVGVHEGWPYVTLERTGLITLGERLSDGSPLTPQEAAAIVVDVLDGLAYAHEAGLVHQDIGLHTVFMDRAGRARLAALGVGLRSGGRSRLDLPALRQACERDVLMVGLLLHRLLAHQPALDEPDFGVAQTRVGAEIVRMPWSTPHTVPDPLRAIVNRATDRQQRQRYLNARTLLSALQRWIKAHSEGAGGPLVLLLDRLNTVGALPGRAGTERALVSALSVETLRVDDLVEVVLKNPAMAWEMMRSVNTASFQSHAEGDGATTLSRAVAMLGQEGIRRVASSIRAWPGVLAAQVSLSADEGALAVSMLDRELRRQCVAGHVARLMAPFSISDEEAALAAMAQCLGSALIAYHFPEEAAQILRLMQELPATEPDARPTPGMQPEAAVSAVLGVELAELTAAVLHHWGLNERLLAAARSLNRSNSVRKPVTREETLRAVASLANELAATVLLEAEKQPSAVHQVYVRYTRALDLTPKECIQNLDLATRLVDGRRRPEPVNPA